MKKTSKKKVPGKDEIIAEYTFKNGVRGKHYENYRKGHTVKILKDNGTTIIQNFILDENAITLEPEVQKYFPNSDSVNNALKTIIKLIPQKI
jgi:hypothetical protein